MKTIVGVTAVMAFVLITAQLNEGLRASHGGQFEAIETAHGLVLYRNAAIAAAFDDPTDGVFADAALSLPPDFANPGYQNRKDGGVCYVWADQIGAEEAGAIRRAVGGSRAWLLVQGGQFVEMVGTINPTAVPAWIPENSLVSMVQVN